MQLRNDDARVEEGVGVGAEAALAGGEVIHMGWL